MERLELFLDKVNGKWLLTTELGDSVGEYDTYQEVVQYCKNGLLNDFNIDCFQVVDTVNAGRVFYDGGNMHTDSQWGMSDGFIITQWLNDGQEEEPEEEVEGYECYHCKDGGCIHCSPNMFI